MRKREIHVFFLTVLTCLSLAAFPARSAEREFSYAPEISVPITLVGLSAWLAGEAFKPQLVEGRDTRGWVNPVDDAVRNALAWSAPRQENANMLSNIGLGAIPVLAGGFLLFADDASFASPSRARAKQAGMGALILLESASVAMLANQTVKFAVLRNRPYTRAGGYEEEKPDDHLSFYSGHTTVAFSLAVAGASLHQMRGGRRPGLVWAAALTLAGVVGYLRIAADKHYFSDVLVGALTGAAAGFLIPRYLHEATEEESESAKKRVALLPMAAPDTWMLGFGFAF